MIYIFSGSQDYWAMTENSAGGNLPAEYGPWVLQKAVPEDEPRLDQGIGRGSLDEIRKHGFSLRQMSVTFEPSITVPDGEA